jgi:hypothetical protein
VFTMTLSERLSEYVRACFTGLWIESHEHADALAEISLLCSQQSWRLATWDIEQGLSVPGTSGSSPVAADPLSAVQALSGLSQPDGTTLLVLQNFHRFLQSAEVVQTLSRQILSGKQTRSFIVILSPVLAIPVELDKLFVTLEHALPTRDQLTEIARGIGTEEGDLPRGAQLEVLLDAAGGLTRYEAEGAFSLSLVRHGRITPEAVWELKCQALRKSGLLSLYRGQETFESLGGLSALKAFCRRSLLRSQGVTQPRGVLLLGVPGVGKTAFAKALGTETGRPTLCLDIGGLMGSLVGQTEQNIRQALRIADAMAPCVLFIDEVEKALSGIGGSGDSGVSSRLFGSLLTWMNDHTSDVYLVATCNDISRLPPEFSRAERFDGIFFLNLPGQADREAIWRLYLTQFGLDPEQARPDDQQWTGAEIRACCRLAALLDLPLVQAAQNVVPVAVTAAESVDRLKTWASGRCLSADLPGIYRSSSGKAVRRKVSPFSNN